MDNFEMSKFSYRSLKVFALDDQKVQLSEATAFSYKRADRLYLVSNWHVMLGKNPINEDWMEPCSHARRPFWLRVVWPNPRGSSSPVECTLPLFDFKKRTDSGELYPLFKTVGGLFSDMMPHPDVAVLPVQGDAADVMGDDHYGGDQVDAGGLSITDTVYVVGYPQNSGMSTGGPPIWTRGSIASEPNSADGRANLLIDARTRPGQSGSPAIQYRRAFTHAAEGGISEFFPEKANLIGVYSGRTDKDSDLGRIWATSVINEAIDHQNWWP